MDGFFDWDLISKLLLATFLGSTIGLERYVHGRPAGFRTYLLVCAAFTSISKGTKGQGHVIQESGLIIF